MEKKDEYTYGEEGPKPPVSPARRKDTEAFSTTPAHVMPRNMGNPGEDPAARVIQKTHQLEQQLLKTRMLLQQCEQDVTCDAYRAAANASSFGSMLGTSPYWLAGAPPGLDPRIQALLQQRRQMENILLPTHHARLVNNPQRPNVDLKRPYLHDGARLGEDTKKRIAIDQTLYADALRHPDPPSDREKEEDPVAEKNDHNDDKEDKKLQYDSNGQPFPLKLYRMLEEAEKNGQEDVLSFLPHGRAFAIHKPGKFKEDIMPRYFGTTRVSSFQRQLNMYGFRRVAEGSDKGSYYHKLFLEGQKELLEKIKRKKPAGPKPTSEDVEKAIRAYQQELSDTGSGFGIPALQFTTGTQNLSRQQDLISRSLVKNVGGQRSVLGDSLPGWLPPSVIDGLLSRQQDLISQREGQRLEPGKTNSVGNNSSVGNCVAGLPPFAMEGLSSLQQDLISQSVMMNRGGQRPELGNSLSWLQPNETERWSDPRMSCESPAQGGNIATTSRLPAAWTGISGLSSNPTTAALLREQEQLKLLIEQLQLQQRRQQLSDLLKRGNH
jgi:hypothetical protein